MPIKRNLFRYERKFILDDISINTLSDLMSYIPINFMRNIVKDL